MQERIIITMTTYSKRIGNIPTVLDTIYAQTVSPDLVVINLAYEEIVPDKVQNYINAHNIEVNRQPDTKVYKKIVPTLKKYPNDCVINIDDDKLYPPEMIADFMDIHNKYPNNPISGNRQIFAGRQCHHGYASLVKAEYFGEYMDLIMDDDVMANCKSSDLVYTYFANKAGNPYIRTTNIYYSNLARYNEVDGYSNKQRGDFGDIYTKTFAYLIDRFGPLQGMIESYVKDPYIAQIIYDINIESQSEEVQNYYKQKYTKLLESSPSYKLGRFLLCPFRAIKRMVNKNKYVPMTQK